MIIAMFSEQGSRSEQQDRIYHSAKYGLAAIADGMGGHPNGGNVAQWCMEKIERYYESASQYPGMITRKNSPLVDPLMVQREMKILIETMHARKLYVQAHRPNLNGGGSTLTTLRYFPEAKFVVWAHVGDTRIYHAIPPTLKGYSWAGTCLTKDQGSGSMLANAFGITPIPQFVVELGYIPFQKHHLIAMTTDGVHDTLAKHGTSFLDLLTSLPVGFLPGDRSGLSALGSTIMQTIKNIGSPSQDNYSLLLLYNV